MATKKPAAKSAPPTQQAPKPTKGAGAALSAEARVALITTLKARFEKFPKRHVGLSWADVQQRLEAAAPAKLRSLFLMEESGGEPDVVAFDKKSGELTFFDCSPESPTGRRSICYDRAALDARKENKPRSSAEDVARELGVSILTEEEYRYLQTLGVFDAKTSSWVATPDAIRKHGGAIFCDHRYGHTFMYHNGADSYYAARAFRGALKV